MAGGRRGGCCLARAGHAKGVQAVRRVVEACGRAGVRYLTLFAFSSENWRRPAEEVSLLMRLFVQALEREIGKLEEQGVRLHVIGDLSPFEPRLRELILAAQARTAHNDRLHLTVAANYGGRWDILQATRAMLAAEPGLATQPELVDEERLARHLSMAWGARTRPVHPHRRRTTHFQFPDLADGLRGVLLHGPLLAGLRRQ